MTDQRKIQKTGKHLIGGVVVLTVGVLFLLRNFNMLGTDLSYYIFSWKTLLIGIGLLNLFLADNKVGGFILIAIGTFFWLPDLFDMSVRAGQLFWPVIIIIVGIMLLLKKPHQFSPNNGPWRRWKHGNRNNPENSLEENNTGSEKSNRSQGTSDEYIDDLAIFSGSTKVITTNNFKGGNMTAIFGGSEVNLSRAKMAPGRNILNVFFMFGGSGIIVPSDWNVVIEATPIFGGFSDERYVPRELQTEDGANSVLVVRGLVLFGGAEIKSY